MCEPCFLYLMTYSMKSRKLIWICIVVIVLIALYVSYRSLVSNVSESPAGKAANTTIKKDDESIERGKILFYRKCKAYFWPLEKTPRFETLPKWRSLKQVLSWNSEVKVLMKKNYNIALSVASL